jgi:hypothetical protein
MVDPSGIDVSPDYLSPEVIEPDNAVSLADNQKN